MSERVAHRRFVVLDRDGTVIVERHYLSDPEHVELIPGVAEALRQLRQMGLGIVILTNQSAIGRGFFDARRLAAIHQRMTDLLRAAQAQVEGIYHCPHRPDDGCICRKPRAGLLERAARELGFEPRDSFVIGDKACDVELGRRVGATTFLVRTGYGARMAEACKAHTDHLVEDLGAAIPVIRRLVNHPGAPHDAAAVARVAS